MSVNYRYEITKVDAAARCMEIEYSAEGYKTYTSGARLPSVGETVEDVVRMYAPLALWEFEKKVDVVPESGITGEIRAADELAASIQIAQEQIANQPQPISTGSQTL